MKKITAENLTFIILLVIAIASRLVVHSWNFTAVMASSFVFAMMYRGSKTKALMLPVLAMLISDVVIGLNGTSFFHATMAFVYIGVGLALVPMFLSRKSLDKTLTKVAAVLAGSVVFFVVSNFGVWIMDGMYPMTFAGLVKCYTMALPFFQNQFIADIILTPVLFVAMKRVLAFDFSQVVIGERH